MMVVEVFPFSGVKRSKPCHGEVNKFRLTHSSGAFFSVMNYGASISSICVRDNKGDLADVVLGFSCLEDYINDNSCQGAVVGRNANRIKNASFTLDGLEYQLQINDGLNNLHSGSPAFQNVFWEGRVVSQKEAEEFISGSHIQVDSELDGEAVLFSCHSPDKAGGFPGNLDVDVLYTWTRDLTLLIVYRGESDAVTLFGPTNHAYFNLRGHDSGDISRQILWVDSKEITNKSADNVPDGTFSQVEGSIFDFSVPRALGPSLRDKHPQILSSSGLDQNYCLHTVHAKASLAASLRDPYTGRKMDVMTNFPGLQVYTANHLGGTCGKSGNEYVPCAGVCLETQLYPDAIHHDNFPSPVVLPRTPCYYVTGYRYSVES